MVGTTLQSLNFKTGLDYFKVSVRCILVIDQKCLLKYFCDLYPVLYPKTHSCNQITVIQGPPVV